MHGGYLFCQFGSDASIAGILLQVLVHLPYARRDGEDDGVVVALVNLVAFAVISRASTALFGANIMIISKWCKRIAEMFTNEKLVFFISNGIALAFQ